MRLTPEEKETVKRRLAQQLESYFKDDGEWQWPWLKANRYETITMIMRHFDDLKLITPMDENYWHGNPSLGSDVGDVCQAAYRLVALSKTPVMFKFNGIDFTLREYPAPEKKEG